MNWIWIIIIVAVIGAIIGFINNGKEGAVEGGLGVAVGCGGGDYSNCPFGIVTCFGNCTVWMAF